MQRPLGVECLTMAEPFRDEVASVNLISGEFVRVETVWNLEVYFARVDRVLVTVKTLVFVDLLAMMDH